ncbi:MAG: peptidoglycan DD-metalloendopeptidase family protein [Clostridia bacterium]|nr:peptidoglycan DD-metalloendopeptidase family protein [Clostridia bacterium]
MTIQKMKNAVAKTLFTVFLLGFTVLFACAEPPDANSGSENGGAASAPTQPDAGDGNGSEYREGYLLTVDGKEIAYIEDSETAKAVTEYLISEYKRKLTESGKTVSAVEILSSFDITLTKCRSDRITDREGAIDSLQASGIKITYGVTESEIKPIAYETVYQNSSSYYEGVKKLKTAGKAGEKQLTYRVTYSGDAETERKLTEEKTVTKPVNEVILVGTKKSTASTGSYAWPTKSIYITSRYGWRTVFGKREYHYGIDLRAAVGTSIYAADGGEVIYVGTQSGYGKLIQIRHDNGDLTYYAHLNSFSVKKGDRVYKGQLIAKSGQTGRVTGPHLHFEIRKNGVRVDPEKYLPKTG